MSRYVVVKIWRDEHNEFRERMLKLDTRPQFPSCYPSADMAVLFQRILDHLEEDRGRVNSLPVPYGPTKNTLYGERFGAGEEFIRFPWPKTSS